MKYRIPPLLLALLVTAVLYWPSLHSPFLFDDIPNLPPCPASTMSRAGATWASTCPSPAASRVAPWRCSASCCRNRAGRTTRFPFHLVNLGIHLFCGLLVYL